MIKVTEKKDESILLKINNDSKIFLPTVNLNKSKELLELFNTIKTKEGKYIYEVWKADELYLFPALQEWLFWNYFVQIVKHNDIRCYIGNRKYIFTEYDYNKINGLKRIQNFLFYKEQHKFFNKILFNCLSFFARKTKKVEKLVLALDDFSGNRYKNLKDIIDKYETYSEVKHITKNIKDYFINIYKNNFLYTGYKKLFYTNEDKIKKFEYNLIEDELKKYIPEKEFYQLLKSINFMLYEIIEESKILERDIKFEKVKKVVFYDQVLQHLALLIVTKKLKIKSISYQHGAITKHHPGWLAYGIKKEYCNLIPDEIFVWGEYWKEKLIKYSNKYDNTNIMIGAYIRNPIKVKVKYFKNISINKKLTILFPYEFLADKIKLSQYIERLITLNFLVIVKLRPKDFGNGDIDRDKYAFSEKIRNKIKFVYDLRENEFINEIDIIGCTQSTYAYEMIQYNKPIWYFETKFTLLEDIYLDKIAYLINDSILNHMDKMKEEYLKPRYNISILNSIFSNNNLESIIKEKIINNIE